MKKLIKLLFILSLTVLLVPAAFATNGDNLIGVGPIARSMGGVGIAQPLDAISAVFANPAAMCFGKYCPGSEFNFAGTLFMPKIDARVTNAGGVANAAGNFRADSEDNVYAIPAIGLSVPIGSESTGWRFGIAAYGVTGLGVDYRGTNIDNSTYIAGAFPLVSGEYTQLQIMKFAPSLAYQLSENFSLGMAVHIDYGNLDLRSGGSPGYAIGVQPGIIYKPTDNLSFGLTYVSPQKIDHDNVTDFDQDGTLDTLELESPQQLGFGVAYDFIEAGVILEANLKWINWKDADGYSEFDWDDQLVFAIGAQFEPVDNLFLRAGYNYAQNPVNEHNNFTGTTTTTVQGKTLPTYYYETFRIIGFPAVVEHHVTFGLGYEISPTFSLELGYMHAFENTITENGTDPAGQAARLESTLSEDSLDFGFTWRF